MATHPQHSLRQHCCRCTRLLGRSPAHSFLTNSTHAKNRLSYCAGCWARLAERAGALGISRQEFIRRRFGA